MSLIEVNLRNIAIKIAIFYFLIIWDIIINSFIELNASLNLKQNPNSFVPFVIFG
jgi:hypothetical protein